MVSRRNRQDVRDGPAVTATRQTETKRTPRSGAVGMTRPKAPVAARHARAAGDLKRDEHPLADTASSDFFTDRDHLGNGLVPDRERPGEEAHRSHRLVQITPRNRERTHQRAARV